MFIVFTEESNTIHYSHLENSMNRGSWTLQSYRVAKSQSWLKRLSVQTWHLLGRSCTIYWVCRHFPKTNILHRAAEKELKNWPCLSVQTRTPISSRGEYTQQPVCWAVKGPVSSPTHLPSVSAEKFLYQDRNLGGKSPFINIRWFGKKYLGSHLKLYSKINRVFLKYKTIFFFTEKSGENVTECYQSPGEKCLWKSKSHG